MNLVLCYLYYIIVNMHIFLLKQNNFKALFLLFIFLSIILIIFNVYYPHEAFAMSPPKDYFTVVDYYGHKEYMGKDSYGHFNCSVKSHDIENTSWGKSKNPDYIIPDKPISSREAYKDVSVKPTSYTDISKNRYIKPNSASYELDSKALHKQVCKPEHKEVNLWVPGQSFRGANPVIYELEDYRPVTFELDADYYEDTISTSLDSTRFNKAIEFVRNYKVLIDNPATKHGVLSSINLGIKTYKNNIVFIYLKFQEIGKRKVLWNIWVKHSNKYESYKHFKRSWDSNTNIWSKIRKDVRENIKAEIEDLLGVKKINKNLKRSVRKEVEKLLREQQPFRY